jgi:phosphonate transport system substrate-binding protein
MSELAPPASDAAPAPVLEPASELTFGLPGSLGAAGAVQRALLLEAYLQQVLELPVTVQVCPDYATLELDLLEGRLSAAWGPPAVGAQVEASGGRVAALGVRGGAGMYRAALLGPADRQVTLDAATPLRAAWVDRQSVAGYLLPRRFLQERGVVPAVSAFEGSYLLALEAVLEGRADVTSTWASGSQAAEQYVGHTRLLGERASQLTVLGFTAECPNDAIVLSPGLDAAAGERLTAAFLAMAEQPDGRSLLQSVFGAERFAAAAPGTYDAVGALFGREK